MLSEHEERDPMYSVGSLATLAYAASKMRDRELGIIARRHLHELYGVRIVVERERKDDGDEDRV